MQYGQRREIQNRLVLMDYIKSSQIHLGGMLGKISPPGSGQTDYALRLISTTKHYEQFAENLKDVYPQNRAILQRAQQNLQFFRREMIDTLWNSFTTNLKQSLVEANPVFTYALISMIQEDPEADWSQKF